MGVRWLVEAKNTALTPYSEWRRASTTEEKDKAVANGLAEVLEAPEAKQLQSSLGYAFLTNWATSFKWENIQDKNNLFMRLLKTIFEYGKGNNSDSYLLKQKLLNGNLVALKNDSTNAQNTQQQNQQTNQQQQNQQNQQSIPEQPAQESWTRDIGIRIDEATPTVPPVRRTVRRKKMDNATATVIDMKPMELFTLLYNGYEKHLYTTNDFANLANNDPNDNDIVTSKDGKKYAISKGLNAIVKKCLQDSGWKDAINNAKNVQRASNNNSNGSPNKQQVIKWLKNMKAPEWEGIKKEVESGRNW